MIRSTVERLRPAPGQLAAWNDSAKQELNHIQKAVEELEQSLGTHPAH
jgi:predicted translin family RNA/ssDNA-binding protein